jgi:hypothetical protein
VRADGGPRAPVEPRRRSAEANAPVSCTRERSRRSLREGLILADGGAFAEAQAKGIQESDLYRDNWHLSAAGQAEIAKTLAEKIEPCSIRAEPGRVEPTR